MNAWLQFLAQHGARVREETDTAELIGFDPGTDGTTRSPTGTFVAPLADLGLIAVSGDDAAAFLHNQLTNDVEGLDDRQARLAGYCSPKGRLLATFLMWKSGDRIMLQLPRQILPAVQKRLQMFVLRSKAKLADLSDEQVALGLSGEPAAGLLKRWFPDLPPAPYASVHSEAGTLVRVQDAFGAPRYLWITDVERAQREWPALAAALRPSGPHAWRMAEIHAGVPQITKATQEQFVPQMINYELIGGVNFRKGCYPGQEIVARSQYLGKLKRRMVLASVDSAEAKAGMEVFLASEPDQPCGMLVNAERNEAGGSDCLVEMKLAALNAGSVHLGSPQGAALTFNAMPYPLPEVA